MNFRQLTNAVLELAEVWGIAGQCDGQKQFLKLIEEFGETLTAVDDEHLLKEIGDVLVVAIILRQQLGYKALIRDSDSSEPFAFAKNPNMIVVFSELAGKLAKGKPCNRELILIEDEVIMLLPKGKTPAHAVEAAYKKISARKGKLIDGVFVKEADL